jgi:hypothetical protein
MSTALILACLWGVAANVIAMTPSRDNHWRNAYILIALGIPIVGAVTAAHGPWIGLLVMLGGCLVLRWPVIYLGRWVLRRVRPAKGSLE